MSEVVVTGAAGFIGRWVVAELLERGYEVVGLDNFTNGEPENIRDFRADSNFSIRRGDVRNEADVNSIVTDETVACIHLAAEIDVHESLENPQSHFKTNVVGTHNVVESCRSTDTEVGLVGTCMVYDTASESNGGISETHPVEPASPYAGTKLAAENVAESYYNSYNLPVTYLRPFNTYGPYQTGGVVPIFVRHDLQGRTIQIYGDGTQTRDLLYVTDCARFIVEGTFNEAATGEILNAGTGRDISINELANQIATEGTEITHVKHHHPQSEIQKLQCDAQKAKALLDWEPEVTLKEGVELLREWLTAAD